jgi:hypothetical protein
VLLVVGAQDDEADIRTPAEQLWRALSGYGPDRTALTSIPVAGWAKRLDLGLVDREHRGSAGPRRNSMSDYRQHLSPGMIKLAA